ncbi:unnamed protein product [Mesocestoides corti]|nr:unnamed protein product [Mesocestoides corti]
MTIDYPPIPADADDAIKMSVKVAKEQMDKMSQSQLASRLTMAFTPGNIDFEELQNADITIVEVGDVDSTYKRHYESVHQAYPGAKVASIDSGGYFPFFSRPDEFVAYMRMHFEAYLDTPYFPAIQDD